MFKKTKNHNITILNIQLFNNQLYLAFIFCIAFIIYRIFLFVLYGQNMIIVIVTTIRDLLSLLLAKLMHKRIAQRHSFIIRILFKFQ